MDAHCAYFGAMLAGSTVLALPALPEPRALSASSPAMSVVLVDEASVFSGCRALAPLF